MELSRNDMNTAIKQLMAIGLTNAGLLRGDTYREMVERALNALITQANEMDFIIRTGVLSAPQLDEVYNDIDMKTEGMDDAQEWSEFQETNY